MSNSPELSPSKRPQDPPPRSGWAWLKVTAAGLGTVCVVGGIVGIVWGKRIVNHQVLPRLEDEIAKTIGRPIELGKVERFSFWGVWLGKTTIPPTATDDSSVTVDAIGIDIDLPSLIFQQTLKTNVILAQPAASLAQGVDGEWFELTLPEPSEEEPFIRLEIQLVEIRDGRLTASTRIQASKALMSRETLKIEEVDATATFHGEDSEQVTFDLTGEVESGSFDIRGEANLESRVVKASVRSRDLPIASANLLMPPDLDFNSGVLNANLMATASFIEAGSLDQTNLDVRGTARLRDGEVMVSDLSEPISNIRSQLRFRGRQVVVDEAGLRWGDLVLTASGAVDLERGYDLTAQIPSIRLSDVQSLANVELPVEAEGAFQLRTQVTGDLGNPRLQGRLANLAPVQVDKVALAAVAADFAVTPSQLDLTELRIVPQQGGIIVANGQADLTDLDDPKFQLAAQVELPVDPLAEIYDVNLPEGTDIGSLSVEIEAEGALQSPTAFARWRLSESTFPGQGEVTVSDNTVFVDNTRFQIAGGEATAVAIAQLEDGDWQAVVVSEEVPVDRFASQVQGRLSAEIEASGNLYNFDLAGIQAAGNAQAADAQIRLTEASEPLLEPGDWTTTFQWRGDRVEIVDFTAPGVQAEGSIGVDFTQSTPIGDLDLDVALQAVSLQPLNSLVPSAVREYAQLSGVTSFRGAVGGTAENPQLEGAARVEGLTLNQIVFGPLTGPVEFSLADGGRVDLSGRADRLQLALDDRFWPTSFEVRNQDFVARGSGDGNRLQADIVQLPLAQLDIQPAPEYGFGPIAGLLSARVEADLSDVDNPLVRGDAFIAQPALEPVEADQIAASFRYGDGVVTLEQGELRLGDSRFLLTGQASLTPELQYEATLTAAEGRIEELVAVLQDIDLSAFGLVPLPRAEGSAGDLAAQPVGLPPGSFLEQLETFRAFVQAQPDETPDADAIAIPPLDDLSGGFTGVIAVQGRSLSLEGVTADFDFQGDSWQWGPYAPSNQFAISGALQRGTLSLDPVLINAGDTAISLFGSASPDRLTGEIMVDNLPVELVEALYPLPVAVDGDLDVMADLSGSLENPLLEAEAAIVNAQVDGQPVDAVSATLSYRNANLNVDGEAAVDPTDAPITLQGRIPYALPFMTVQPNTDQMAMRIVAPSDSFDLINRFTADQVRWESGEGEGVVQVSGTLEKPIAIGNVRLRDGFISSDLLASPLTNVSGDLQFNLERVVIQQLQANLGSGSVEITGQLPLLPSGQSLLAQTQAKQQPSRVDALLIALDQLPVDYSGVSQAVFDGRVSITGAVVAPTVGGGVEISQGFVQANEFLDQVGALALPTESELEGVNPYRAQYLGIDPLSPRRAETSSDFPDNVTFDDFRVVFSDRLVIAGQPFYTIGALGSLTVNGTLAEPEPSGVIELQSGWINLFSTQFRLAANAPNTATFTPENGLDPFVDVVMTARVQETDITSAPRASGGFVSPEVNDNANIETFGEVQFIRVQAVARGPASELRDNLVLRSRPRRSEEQLIALLGSDLAGGLTTATFTQLTGFLGAGRLASFGNTLANTLGLQSFSVFPTTDTSTESTAGIGIGVEAAFNIGDSFGVNVLEILNNDNPPQFGLQYRLTDELRLRGSSNLNDTEARLEYRISF